MVKKGVKRGIKKGTGSGGDKTPAILKAAKKKAAKGK